MITRAAALVTLIIGLANPALAGGVGPETNLPLPRFVSMSAAKANVRRGPSQSHRIDWVFQRRNMPLEVTAEYGHWRRVRDNEGAGGWVHYTLLSGTRHVIFAANVDVLARPAGAARVVARAEEGAVARLGECRDTWCRVQSGRVRGWVAKRAIWGDPTDLAAD